MYIPASFAEDDLSKLHDFITAHSFATLVSSDPRADQPDRGPLASHLPILCDRAAGPRGGLIGHMATANSHWQHLDGKTARIIFNGPHAYVSPSWCAVANAVPTWNYVAVHASGIVRIEREPGRLADIVQAYVDFYERTMPIPWRLDSADTDFVESLLDAIVGFTIEIEHIEGKMKLSQNHAPQRRTSIIEGLRSLGGKDREQIAELMAKTIQT